MKIVSQHTALWGLGLLILIVIIVRSRRAEGLQNKKPKKPKKDIVITGNLPANVKSVLKKPDGEYVVIKDNGKKVRYPDQMVPSFLRTVQKKKTPAPRNAKERKRRERELSVTETAIAKLERQLEKIQDGIEKLQGEFEEDARERHMMERVRDLIDRKLRAIRENGRIPGMLPLPKDSSEGYVDRGDTWVLA